MTETDYQSWMMYHRSLFGMKAQEDVQMFSHWWPVLMHYSARELREASLAIASDIETAGRYRTEHLALLRSKIQSKRMEAERSLRAHQEERFLNTECQLCGDSGTVSVPHPASIKSEAWVYPFYSASVFCRCNRGVRLFNSYSEGFGRSKFTALDFDKYELQFPHWRRLVADREELRKAEYEAKYAAKQGDKRDPIDKQQVLKAINQVMDKVRK